MRCRLLIALLALSGCAQPRTVPVTVANDPASIAALMQRIGISSVPGPLPGLPGAGERFTGEVTLYGRPFALPPGTWTVAESGALTSNKIGPLRAEISLIQAQEQRLAGVVSLSTTVRPGIHDAKPSLICLSADVLWSDPRLAAAGADQDCVAVNYFRMVTFRQAPATQPGKVLNFLDLSGIQPPTYMVGLSVVETDRQATIDEEYLINPDFRGIAPDNATLRTTSAWASFNYPKDPQKVRLIEELKADTAEIRARLRQLLSAPATAPGGPLTPA